MMSYCRHGNRQCMRLLGLDQGNGGRASFDVGRQVINFDMPKEIENYVHRIGRTGSLESFPYHLIIPQRHTVLHIRTVPQAIVPLRGHSNMSRFSAMSRDFLTAPGRCGRTGVATTFVNKNQDVACQQEARRSCKDAEANAPFNFSGLIHLGRCLHMPPYFLSHFR